MEEINRDRPSCRLKKWSRATRNEDLYILVACHALTLEGAMDLRAVSYGLIDQVLNFHFFTLFFDGQAV